MKFIGLRPFTIFIQDGLIYTYAPDTAIVRTNNVKAHPRHSDPWVVLYPDINQVLTYVPTLCLDLSDSSYPEWFVASEPDDYNTASMSAPIGTVVWDKDHWNITQDIIGRHTFDVTVPQGGVGIEVPGILSDDATFVSFPDGTTYPLDPMQTQDILDAGYSPGDSVPGEFTMAFD